MEQNTSVTDPFHPDYLIHIISACLSIFKH